MISDFASLVFLSMVSLAEVYEGVFYSRDPRKRDKIIGHLSRAKEELKSAQGEIENLESYLVSKIGEEVSFKHYPQETDQVS